MGWQIRTRSALSKCYCGPDHSGMTLRPSQRHSPKKLSAYLSIQNRMDDYLYHFVELVGNRSVSVYHEMEKNV